MRFAISAMVGLSGLVLLGLGIYGQPATYLHEARVQWDELMDVPAAEPSDDTRSDQVSQLRRQVSQLEDELAAKAVPQNVPAPSPPVPTAAITQPDQPAPPVAMAVPQQREAPALSSVLPKPDMAQSEPVRSDIAVAPPPPPDPPKIEPSHTEVAPAEPAPKVEALKLTAPKESPVAEPPKVASLKIEIPKPDAPITVAKPDVARAEVVVARPETIKPEVTKGEFGKTETPKAPPQKLALARPPPPPPPVRPETDDAQSVLARLRQVSSPPPRATDPPQSAEPRPKPAPSPSIPRLTAARSALAAGRVEDARRLLQEAQLQLVFRPVNLPGDEQPSAARGASDVARALEALSANDTSLGRRFIDGAIDDLSGAGTLPPVQDVQLRSTGYAPAYPPR